MYGTLTMTIDGDRLERAILERVAASIDHSLDIGLPHQAAVMIADYLEEKDWQVALKATSEHVLSALQSDIMFLSQRQWPIASGRSSPIVALDYDRSVLTLAFEGQGERIEIGDIPLSEVTGRDA